MSTSTQTPPQTPALAPATLTDQPTIPLTRLIRVELRKMVDTRTGLWLLIIITVTTAAAVVLATMFAPDTTRTLTGYAALARTPQGMLLPVLGILLVTSEWGQRTGLVTFTLEPRRGLVVTAKILAAVILALAILAFVLLIAAAATALSSSPADTPWDFTPQIAGHMTLIQLLGILQGIGLGLLLMNSAAAIVAYFLLPTVLTMIFTLVESLSEIAPWVDLGTAQAALLGAEAMTGQQWAQLGIAALIWIALPLLLGFIRLQRAEIKTA